MPLFSLCSSEQNEDETSQKDGLSTSANSSMSCSGTSIIWFCFSTAGSIVIQVYSRGPMQQWWQFSFIFIKSGKHIYLHDFSPVKSNVQSNYFHKYAIVQLKGTVYCLNLDHWTQRVWHCYWLWDPVQGFLHAKWKSACNWIQKNVWICKYMPVSNILWQYSGLKGMLLFKNECYYSRPLETVGSWFETV